MLKFDSSFSRDRERRHTQKKLAPKAPSEKKENLALALQEEKREENAGVAKREDLKRQRVLARSRTQRRVSLSLSVFLWRLSFSLRFVFLFIHSYRASSIGRRVT